MLFSTKNIPYLFAYITLLIASISLDASAMVITTPIPGEGEPSAVPIGYVSCFQTATGSYRGIWSSGHRICQYNLQGNNMYVTGYWQCYRFNAAKGLCYTWQWVPAHWSNKSDIQTTPDQVMQRSGWHVARRYR